MDLTKLKQDIEAKSEQVDERLAEFLGRDEAVDNLHEALLYALGLDIDDRIKRGKRVACNIGDKPHIRTRINFGVAVILNVAEGFSNHEVQITVAIYIGKAGRSVRTDTNCAEWITCRVGN